MISMADDNPLTKELDDLHKQAKGARRMLEPEWFLCLSYFQGKQWLKWANGQLQQPVEVERRAGSLSPLRTPTFPGPAPAAGTAEEPDRRRAALRRG